MFTILQAQSQDVSEMKTEILKTLNFLWPLDEHWQGVETTTGTGVLTLWRLSLPYG